MFAMLISLTFLLPVFMQEMLGFTAVQSGMALMPRALTMMVMMPIIGRLYNKVSPRLTVAFGICMFSISAYMMSHYTLDTTQKDIIAVLIIQGIAFACLFIPLTTVALAQVPRHKLPDATGLNSLLRQIGGSMGLAVIATFIPRFTQSAMQSVGAHVTMTRPEVSGRVMGITQAFESRGYDFQSATQAAERAMQGLVARQAAVLMFEKLFLFSGIAFLFVLPLLLFLKSPDHDGGEVVKIDAHVEV